MPGNRSSYFILFLAPIFILFAASALAQPAAAPPARLEQLAAGALSPESLPKVLSNGAAALDDNIKALAKQLTERQQRLAERQADLKNLQVAAAAMRAALAVERPPLTQYQELQASYGLLDTQNKERAWLLGEEMAALKQKMLAGTVAENALRNQVSFLQGAGEPTAVSPEMQQALSRYLQLADQRDRLAAQVYDVLEQTRQVLGQEQQLLAGLQPDLKSLEEAWKSELLKRPPTRLSLSKRLSRLGAGLAALPGKGWNWLTAVAASGELRGFFLGHLVHLLGLVAFLVLLAWSTRRLRRLTARRLSDWRAQATDLDLLPIFRLGQILVNSLFRLVLVLWAAVLCWSFGFLNGNPALFALYLLGAYWAWRLALDLVQNWFAGKAAGGVLELDKATARFYRRSLKVFVTYLALGLFALTSAPLLNFPEGSRLFAQHVFLEGLMVLVLWLLRREPRRRLHPLLPDPAWMRRPVVGHIIKGVVLFLLTVTILADLMGLPYLAGYIARAATSTGLAVLLFWFLWLAGHAVIHHLLHPDLGWAKYYYPEKQQLLQKLYRFSNQVISVLLAAAVIFWSLSLWGIPPERVAWAFQWLTWGPTIGPVKLTILNLVSVALALYLGFWFSRLLRGFMLFRIFPRLSLDEGVQYTVSTTVHYVILILAVIVALNILGFPLTNLALVAGALGVGIGFGLQNIVNNFISGLILLFERPIKVGDMLVIDGQWGTVKEIRVRSTIFETFDRYVLIIPNSDLISHKVVNWTHYGRGINRLTLKVKVASDSDVEQVTLLINETCLANERVVKEPPPQIFFEVYGEITLDFNIWVHLKTPMDRVPATHELNSAILETFRQHGIEMPFPQLDLHIRDWPAPPEKP